MEIEIDLIKDWVDVLKQQMISWGYEFSGKEDNQEISFAYYNLMKRIVNPVPRKVVFSSEFTCPNKYRKGLNILIDKLERGEAVTNNLSKSIGDLKYNDGLLNDWGVYHFHLGTKIEDGGFVERSGPLLFARLDNKFAYFINVLSHGSWSKKDILRCVYENWPESIERYRLHGVSSIEDQPTDNDVATFRKNGISTLIQFDDNAYFSPGGGYMSSGISMEVVRTSDGVMNSLLLKQISLEKYLRKNEQIFEGIGKFKVSLNLQEDTWYINDESGTFSMKLDDIPQIE